MQFIFWQTISPDWTYFILFLVTILCLVGISELLLKQNILSADASRIIIHCTVGMACSLSPFLFISKSPPILLGFVFLILNATALKLEKFKGIHSQERLSYGTIYFPLAYLVMVTFFWDFTHYFVISFSIMSIADPLATVVGMSLIHI